jgi:hypothetical protein
VLAALAASGQLAYDALCFALTLPLAGTPLMEGPKNFFTGVRIRSRGPWECYQKRYYSNSKTGWSKGDYRISKIAIIPSKRHVLEV